MTEELTSEGLEKAREKSEAEKSDARNLIKSGVGRKGPLEQTGLKHEQAFEDLGNGRARARGSGRIFRITTENGRRRITAEDDDPSNS